MLTTIVHIFHAGGFVMYPLVLFMLASWTIGIERILVYYRFNKEMRDFYSAYDGIAGDTGFPDMVTRLGSLESELGKQVYAVVANATDMHAMESRFHEIVAYTDCYLKRGLHWLSMIVTMAPLLGLLGTVLGMIGAFHAIGGDINSPAVITGGVSEALVATATGLTVAIVALAFHSYCANQVNKNINHLEHQLGVTLDIYNRSGHQ